jgi:carbamoyl-phosphate synthase large subunit
MRHRWQGCPEGRARVLVTGVGGNIGQGILKALSAARLASWTVGTDCEPASAGLYAVDRGYVVPRADAPDFLDALFAIIDREAVDLVLVGADAETIHLARLREPIAARTGTLVLVADPKVVERSHDKWLAAQWFNEQKFLHPATVRADDRTGISELTAQFERIVVKPRFGFGSRGIVIAAKPAEIISAADNLGANGIVQEYIGDDSKEFTGAALCDKQGQVRASLVMQRELLHGTSYRIRPVEDALLTKTLENWAARFAAIGPVNFQFRDTPAGPVCFEINARFSGTTGVRYLFGYNDVAMAVRHFLFDEPIERPSTTAGVVLRLWDEMLVPAIDAKIVDAATVIESGSPRRQV